MVQVMFNPLLGLVNLGLVNPSGPMYKFAGFNPHVNVQIMDNLHRESSYRVK